MLLPNANCNVLCLHVTKATEQNGVYYGDGRDLKTKYFNHKSGHFLSLSKQA